MTKEWKINSKRKDPDSFMRCKVCKGIPTRWYKLMSTTVYRCEEHKKEISSPVYDQGKISSRGECIGMEINPTFEGGISKVSDYLAKSGQKVDVKALEHEVRTCKEDHSWISKDDPKYTEKIKHWADTHLRKCHPILFSTMTYYDDQGEHNLIIEDPEEYFLCKLSKEQVSDHFVRPIPKDLVGMDVSAREIWKR